METKAGAHLGFYIRRGRRGPLGPDCFKLLEAIAASGSLRLAAEALGLSYKTAWNSVQAINNLFDHPIVVTKVGGRDGGSTEVASTGLRLLTRFRVLEAEMAAALKQVEDEPR